MEELKKAIIALIMDTEDRKTLRVILAILIERLR